MRIIPWVDPFTNEPLEETDTHLIHKNSKYPIIDGIPKFVQSESNDDQYKIQKCISYQWTKSDFGQPEKFSDEAIKQDIIETMDLTEEDLTLFNDKLVLDVGVGSGASSRLWSPRAKEFHGIDIGDGIYRAKNTLKNSTKNPILSHADLHHLPYKDESFDVIVSNGVLHHTPSTKLALKSIYPKLKKGGIIIFYIYKIKAPLREFSDDYIRKCISHLSPDEAFEQMKPLTKLAESLSKQDIKITIPEDMPLLGFEKGEYNLQRFIYQNIFKLFWKDSMGFDESNMENYDWYYPEYSWRHSKDEINQWFDEFNLRPKLIKENYSGFTCHAYRD